MIDQTIEITRMLKELNNIGFPTSTVETELRFSSGYLWKVKKGHKTLGEEKLKEFTDYYKKHCKKVVHQAPVIIHKPKDKNIIPSSAPNVIEIKFKSTKEATPGSLADMMRAARSESGRAVAAPYSRKKY